MKDERSKSVGGYSLTERIGRGRYGVCFLAQGPDGETVVIKKFKPGIFKKNGEKNKFEAVILSSLDDRRIPALLGVINEPGGCRFGKQSAPLRQKRRRGPAFLAWLAGCFQTKRQYYFVLEYKPGVTLKDMIFKYKHRFTPEEFFNIGTRLIDTVAYLHARGVVHRDVRVPNVLVDGAEVYLIDFGLARFADGGKYRYELDFSSLRDLFLYLLYTSYEKGAGKKSRPWHEELPLTDGQRLFMKKLFVLEHNGAEHYTNIRAIRNDFEKYFTPSSL